MAKGDVYIWEQVQIPSCWSITANGFWKIQQEDQEEDSNPYITIDSFFDNEDLDGYFSLRAASAKKSSDNRRISFDMDPEMYMVEIDECREGMPEMRTQMMSNPNQIMLSDSYVQVQGQSSWICMDFIEM